MFRAPDSEPLSLVPGFPQQSGEQIIMQVFSNMMQESLHLCYK